MLFLLFKTSKEGGASRAGELGISLRFGGGRSNGESGDGKQGDDGEEGIKVDYYHYLGVEDWCV